MLESMQITVMTREAFDNMLIKETICNYNNYRLVSRQVLWLGVIGTPKEVEWMHYKCLESRLNQLTSAISSLSKRLAGKDIEKDMEYEEKLVHHAPIFIYNPVVFIASRVKDNIMNIMIVSVIALQSTAPSNPMGNFT